MDVYLRQNHNYPKHRPDRENPSFSSTLLDAIYRSIDGPQGEDELVLYRETKKNQYTNCTVDENDIASARQACMIEKWMEKKVGEKQEIVRRKSVAKLERTVYLNSSSSASDSSSGGLFTSSEPESVHQFPSRQPSYTLRRPKPIRTSSISLQQEKLNKRENELNKFGNYQEIVHVSEPKSKQGGGFVKTKSKASKIYSDLKKVKQPISPGGKLASFLNSLFTAGNAKKAKISSARRGFDDASLDKKQKSGYESSTCSSAASFSRSCLSKTPSSRGKSSNDMKRTVRFYPVSVIVDEDCQPCGQSSLYEDERVNLKVVRNSMNDDLKTHLKEKNRRVEEAARELLKNYHKQVENYVDLRNVNKKHEDEFEEDYDDAGSDASSDLFELDNISTIGMQRYSEELPVYETTYLDTNRAIANGLIM